MLTSFQQLRKTPFYVQALNGGGSQAERDLNVQDSYGSGFTIRAYALNMLWDNFDLLYFFWFSKERVEYIKKKCMIDSFLLLLSNKFA